MSWITHRQSYSKEYGAWKQMLQRCRNPKNDAYQNYGGRGIRVCAAWLRFEGFFADMGPRPSPQHTVERIDNDGNYEPGNCRWATRSEQLRNRRNNIFVEILGVRMCLRDACAFLGIPMSTARYRIRRGLPLENRNGRLQDAL
jgi:hypothetical protein